LNEPLTASPTPGPNDGAKRSLTLGDQRYIWTAKRLINHQLDPRSIKKGNHNDPSDRLVTSSPVGPPSRPVPLVDPAARSIDGR
jgi:hypothetical protein